MEFDQIISELKKKVFHPVYFLMGNEPYYIDQIAEYIEKNLLDDAMKAFNQTVVYGKDTDVVKIIELCRGFPMMASFKVVIVKEAQDVKKIEELEKYLNNPLKTTILVVCYKYKPLDQRTKFSRLVAKQGVLFESAELRDYQVPKWIEKHLNNLGRSITPQAAQIMADFLGTDLGRIVSELDKLVVALPGITQYTPEHIEKNIGISREFSIFELQNALAEKNVLKANRIINHFGATPTDNPIQKTIAGLFTYFSRLFVCHFLPDKSESGISSKFGVPPFVAKLYFAATKRYSTTKLYEIMGILREYDVRSKGFGGTTSATDSDLYKEMIFKILH